MSLTRAVKAEAHRLGFQLAGVTTPDPPPHFGVYEAWLDAGRHGEMGYLATERARRRRADPLQILPGCRSILVLGMRHPSPTLRNNTERDDESILGRVASYAWGADYHDLLPERLRVLVAFIESWTGHHVTNRWYTDTGPILERDLAQRAGLGWIGKNTCLIHPRWGSYFLLAEILLGIDLDPDPPFEPDRCGSCRRCLEACPTSCIRQDRTLDASSCISYLTIELKGAIPPDLRPKLGEWVFGCDICQQVCPWNQRYAYTHSSLDLQVEAAFAPRPGVPRPDLIQELALTSEEFNRKFSPSKRTGSPVKRAKRRGYLRNVAVALGISSGGGANVAPQVLLRTLANDPEPLVRGHAAWALGHIGGKAARQALAMAADREVDASVLAEIWDALTSSEEVVTR